MTCDTAASLPGHTQDTGPACRPERATDMSNAPTLLDRYRLMVTMRAFEEACAQGIPTGELRGELHLADGQEAVAAAGERTNKLLEVIRSKAPPRLQIRQQGGMGGVTFCIQSSRRRPSVQELRELGTGCHPVLLVLDGVVIYSPPEVAEAASLLSPSLPSDVAALLLGQNPDENAIDNLSCPNLNPNELDCYSQAQLCDGITDCTGGSDEGNNIVSLVCGEFGRSTLSPL